MDNAKNKITTFGVQIPTRKDIYKPILPELKEYGIVFNELNVPYRGYDATLIEG